MKKEIQMVKDFHDAYGLDYSKSPTKDIPEDYRDLRIKLIQEEFDELVEALKNEPLENIAKELADLQYVVFDMVMALGLQDKFSEIFAEVHRSNMSKLGEDGKPIRREDGKIQKGPNYSKADIKKILGL